MSTKNFATALKAMKKNWKEGKEESKKMFGAEDLPDDGKYEATLGKCELDQMPDGKLVINREFILVGGEHEGVMLRDRLFIENPTGAAFADRWIQNHGYESPEDPAELPDVLAAIQEEQPLCSIRAKRNGNFMNINVLAVIAAGEGEPVEEGEPAEETAEEAVEESSEEAVEEETEEAAEEAVEEDDAELKEKLINFCAAQGIDATEENTVDQLKEAINGFNYKEEELTSEEIELLNEIGQSENIVAKPKAAKPAPAPAKAPAKAAPAKAASAPTKTPSKPAPAPAKAPAKAAPAPVKSGVKKVGKK